MFMKKKLETFLFWFLFQILTSDIFGQVTFDGTCFRSQNNIVLLGVALVRIVAPKHLKLPILPYRSIKGRSCLALCKKCADDNQLSECTHTDWYKTHGYNGPTLKVISLKGALLVWHILHS